MNCVYALSACVAVASTVMVITRRNAVHALLYLVVSLLAVAVIMFLLGRRLRRGPGGHHLRGGDHGPVRVRDHADRAASHRGARGMDRAAHPGAGAPCRACLRGGLGRRLRLPWRRSRPSRWAWRSSGPYLLGAEMAAFLLLAGLVGAYHSGALRYRGTKGGIDGIGSLRIRACFAGVLFVLGLAGVIVRRNLLFILLCVEIMLNAAGLAFMVAGARWGQPDGQVMFIFLLTMAAAEVAVGLALILSCTAAGKTSIPMPWVGGSRIGGNQWAGARLAELWRVAQGVAPGRCSPMSWMWLIPAFPLLGFLFLAVLGRRLAPAGVAAVGTGSVGLPAGGIAAVGAFWGSPPAGGSVTLTLWEWVRVGSFSPGVSLTLDALSVVMILVVTVIGFLIHLYSVRFMAGEEGYSRFFAYMNLFVGSMLLLVLAGNLLLLYLGWEGVGLCSYLLIGFWYSDPENGRSARKAFIVTRVGDVALVIGLFLIATNLGSLDIQEVARKAAAAWAPGSAIAVATAALILGGAVGKSAQLPLHTWLPDAMAGPSPVSALIHAATMVTAGVYLIARTHALFTLAPDVMTATAIVGIAGSSWRGSAPWPRRTSSGCSPTPR